jgi:hypothetical protein
MRSAGSGAVPGRYGPAGCLFVSDRPGPAAVADHAVVECVDPVPLAGRDLARGYYPEVLDLEIDPADRSDRAAAVALRAAVVDAARAAAAGHGRGAEPRAWLPFVQNGPGCRPSGHAARTVVQRFRQARPEALYQSFHLSSYVRSPPTL